MAVYQLAAAQEFALPAVIELLDEPQHFHKAKLVLEEMGPTAASVLPELTEINLEGTDCWQTAGKADGPRAIYDSNKHLRALNTRSIIEAIEPGCVDSIRSEAVLEAAEWQQAANERLNDPATRAAAAADAVSRLTGQYPTYSSAARELLMDHPHAYAAVPFLLDWAEHMQLLRYAGILRDGEPQWKFFYQGFRYDGPDYPTGHRSPAEKAVVELLTRCAKQSLPEFRKLLSQPEHCCWMIAACAEALYGNLGNYHHELVDGYICGNGYFDSPPMDYIRAHKQEIVPLVVARLMEAKEKERDDFRGPYPHRLLLSIYGQHLSHLGCYYFFDKPVDEPIAGLAGMEDTVIEAARSLPHPERSAAYFAMRLWPHADPGFVALVQEPVMNSNRYAPHEEARVGLDSMVKGHFNSPEILELALELSRHPKYHYRVWGAKLLVSKGWDDPLAKEALARLASDPAEEVRAAATADGGP